MTTPPPGGTQAEARAAEIAADLDRIGTWSTHAIGEAPAGAFVALSQAYDHCTWLLAERARLLAERTRLLARLAVIRRAAVTADEQGAGIDPVWLRNELDAMQDKSEGPP